MNFFMSFLLFLVVNTADEFANQCQRLVNQSSQFLELRLNRFVRNHTGFFNALVFIFNRFSKPGQILLVAF